MEKAQTGLFFVVYVNDMQMPAHPLNKVLIFSILHPYILNAAQINAMLLLSLHNFYYFM